MESTIKKLSYIDAIRGIAILGVVMVHSSQLVPPASHFFQVAMGGGARGVQLFYLASALTLCMSWMARSSNEQSPIRNFYIRRIFRIAPMFYIAIGLYTFLDGFSPMYWAPNGLEWWYIPMTAFFLHGFTPETINSVVPGGWSIAVEVSFYLVLPFLLPFVKSINSILILLIISFLIFLVTKVTIPHLFVYPEDQKYLVDHFIVLNFFGQLPVFIMGILCYKIINARYSAIKIGIYCCCVTVFCALLLSFNRIYFPFPNHIVVSGIFSAFIIILSKWPIKIIVNLITTRLGELSFSIYLTHFAILSFFHRIGLCDIFAPTNLGSFFHYLCVVIAASGASMICYHYIELPCVGFGKRLIRRLEGVSRHAGVVALN